MTGVQTKQNDTFAALKDTYGYTNPMAAPRVEKVVISTGTGSITDKKKIELIQDRLAHIAGQKPAARPAKKSIASFKLREGDIVGYQVTLRGGRMYDFLEKLINVGFPRTRDFRGISADMIDTMGNLSIGIREHTIFPETPDEELQNVFGFTITVVTTAASKEEATAFLTHLGFPFQAAETPST